MQGSKEPSIMFCFLWPGNNLPAAKIADRKYVWQIQKCNKMQFWRILKHGKSLQVRTGVKSAFI